MNKIKKAPTTTVAVLAPKQYITALDQVLEIGFLGCLESPINVFKVNWTRLFFVFANFFVLWFFTVWLCDIWCTLLWKKIIKYAKIVSSSRYLIHHYNIRFFCTLLIVPRCMVHKYAHTKCFLRKCSNAAPRVFYEKNYTRWANV